MPCGCHRRRPRSPSIDLDSTRRWRRQIAAGETGHPADAGGATFPALDDFWSAWLVAIARGMGWILRVAVGIERPLDEILGEAEPVGDTGMIDDDAVGLVRCRAESAADHLAVEAHLLGRPRQDQAAERRHIPALGQHHAVRDNLDFAGGQPRQSGIALIHRRRAVDVFGADTGGDEIVADMDRVTDGGGKADGFAPLAEFDPVGDDVADQFRPVHAVGEFAFDVVAVPDVNAMQIRIDRRVDAGRNQEILRDELADLWTLDHGLEDAAETAAVATAWRGSEAEQDRCRIALDDRPVALAPRRGGIHRR